MLKKTITYTDYNGTERTEDFYFNLNQAEMIEMETGISGGYVEWVESVVKAKDGPTIMKLFKDFIAKSYGIKSPDGVRFEKSEAISTAFMQTEAYNILFLELVTDADAAAAFVNAIVPKAIETKSNQKNITNVSPV